MKRIVTFLILCFVVSYCQAQLVSDSNFTYRSISVAMQNPDKVFKLNLSKTNLHEIPNDVFKLTNLRELYLSKNHIKQIPSAIILLQNLQILDLASNDIDSLPTEIGTLRKLKTLLLNRNTITALPNSIGDLIQLELLELWDNELLTLPPEMIKLSNLKVIELRGILFSDDERDYILDLFPTTKVFISPSCNCKF